LAGAVTKLDDKYQPRRFDEMVADPCGLVTRNARRIASNIAKLSELLGRKD